MLQAVACFIIEYVSTLPDMKKRGKIIKHLSRVAYIPLENELIRSYILSANTKLQSTLEFPSNEMIDRLQDDFSNSKHVDIQQKAIEFKMLKKNAGKFAQHILMQTPMNEAMFRNQKYIYIQR